MKTVGIIIGIFGLVGFCVMIYSCLAVAGRADEEITHMNFAGWRQCRGCTGSFVPWQSDAKDADHFCSEGCEQYQNSRTA